MSEQKNQSLTSSEATDRLESWKEIAVYLGREVRTVQGWEKTEGLPIHRHQHSWVGTIFAFKSELDAWREARKTSPEPPQPPEPIPVEAPPAQPAAAGNKWMWFAAAAGVVIAVALIVWFVRRDSTPSETISSVVVLPFIDMSPQKDQEYFSDGLTEEIIDALSRVPNLKVVARTSAFAFKGKNADIRQIAKQLDVTTVLEGSVRKAGDQLRITAQLNRAADGTHLWSRTYDRQLRDIFAVQSEISRAIANQLRAGQAPQSAAANPAPGGNMDAYRLYQEGRYFFNQYLPPESNRKAIERYEQAIARDPKFALAYAGIADAYAYLAENFVVAPKEVMPKAKEAAEKAVALNDGLAEGHIALGTFKMDYEWDRAGAQAEFRRALQLNPGSSWAHHWYAHSLEATGKLDEAMKEMRTALALDPLSEAIYWDIGAELFYAGRYDEGIAHLKKGIELFPGQPLLLFMLAWDYYKKGDIASVHSTIESLKATAAASGID